ncbi:MAG: hypothetical protein WAT93_12100 [Pontixanthobacter sp.]
MLLCAPWLFVFRLGGADSSLFLVAMAISVFMSTFPYGAAVSIVLDNAPKAIQSTAAGFTMFAANVLVIGTGTWLIGADIFTVCSAGLFLWLHFHNRREE